MGFTVVVHHGGAFVGDRMLGYEGGEVHVFHNLDVDSWSYFEALGLIKDLGYREAVKLWWNVGNGKKGKIFKRISWDSRALEMCQYAVDNNCEVDMYVEHTLVSQPVLLEESTLLTFNNKGEKEKEEVEKGVLGDQKLDDDDKVEEGDGGKKETWGWMMDLRRQLLNRMWKCPLPPSEPEGDAQTTNVNSQTTDKGKQTMESNSSVQQPSTKIQRTNKGKGKMVAEGSKSADGGNGQKCKAQVQGQNHKTAPKAQKGHAEQAQKTAPKAQKGKNQAPKTAPQAQKGKKEAPKIAPKAQKSASQGQHASSSQPTKPRLGSKGNKKQSANLEAEGVQVEVPPIPAYAKNLTVAQLLARMMTTNNTWAAAVRAHSEIHSTPSDVTMQEAYAIMPTQNSKVGGEKEDGSPNPS
ncbi:hypothetical protein SESBI_34090 [Sesbania bispinosa]|nr:hypothetical protein SESBI_34090 [Sesbania bispinosa]